VNAWIVNNWSTYVGYLLSKPASLNLNSVRDFVKRLAAALTRKSLEGHIICSVISDSFNCDFIKEPAMNTLLVDFELNVILTLLTKMTTKSRSNLVVFAFFRALIYNQSNSQLLNERCLEELQFVIQNREKLPIARS